MPSKALSKDRLVSPNVEEIGKIVALKGWGVQWGSSQLIQSVLGGQDWSLSPAFESHSDHPVLQDVQDACADRALELRECLENESLGPSISPSTLVATLSKKAERNSWLLTTC